MKRIMRFIGNNPEPEQALYASVVEMRSAQSLAAAWKKLPPRRKRHTIKARLIPAPPVPVLPPRIKSEPFETNLMEPLVGWRVWKIAHGRLTSMYQHVEPWPPDEPYRAKCFERRCVESPTRNHTCGLYAKNDFRQVREFLHDGEACGVVLGWGRYVRGVDGWRSEFAYPARILIARDSLRDLEKLKDYHVPLYVMEPMRLYDPAEDGYEYWQNEEDWNFGAGAESHAQKGFGEDDEA